MKQLETGVKIYYHKNGNIKHIYSPYYERKENNPLRGTILNYLTNKLKQIIK